MPNEPRSRSQSGRMLLYWVLVLVPLLWGVVSTLKKAALLFL